MNISGILRYCGISLVGVSLLMMVSAGVAWHEKSEAAMVPLSYAGLMTAIVGLFPLIFVPRQKSIGVREGFFIVTFSWVSACIFGALPYMMFGGEFTLVNALFESVSGFTTTGASILNDIEALPNGLLFWRIASAWIGGIGIVTLVSLMIPARNDMRSVLASAECSDLARAGFSGRKKHFVYTMLSIYTGITTITAVALRICGMRWFDAVTHAMSACSTCGFSTRNASIAAFGSPGIELVLIVAMIMGGSNFALLRSTFMPCHNGRSILKSEIFRTFILGIMTASVAVAADLLLNGRSTSFTGALRQAVFQIASISTTTGFATADTDTWPALSVAVLCLCSVFCGCTGSTSGGIKVDRALLAAKSMKSRLHSLAHPSHVMCVRIDGHIRRVEEVEDACIFILFYLALTVAGGFINSAGGMDLRSGFSASMACMGNVGPGFGSVGSMGNYSSLPDALKINSMILMLLGRLEIYPFFLIFGDYNRKRVRYKA